MKFYRSYYVTFPLNTLQRLSAAHQIRLAFKASDDLVLIYSILHIPYHILANFLCPQAKLSSLCSFALNTSFCLECFPLPHVRMSKSCQ